VDYCELSFSIDPVLPGREVLIAELSELGFESFVEEDAGLKAYIVGEGPSDDNLQELHAFSMPDATISYERRIVPRENWNAKWESSFQPIQVEGRVTVRAPFHDPSGAPFDIVIQPKMSFGTGHHETTWLMMRCMTDMDFNGKAVLDMGSGTGVLTILAEKQGCRHAVAIDIDDWAKENCEENVSLNGCCRIKAYKGDASLLGSEKFDVVIANINRNVLLNDMQAYVNVLNTPGDLLLSGFFTSDIPRLRAEVEQHELTLKHEWSRNDWACLHFEKG
jgi:ribosomal protein L11 methyltransferase